MARNTKTLLMQSVEQGADLLAKYRRRVKRAFRSRPAEQATGTAVANPGVTEDEDARQARHSGSQPAEGENT